MWVARQEDVLWLERAVDEAALVRRFERLRDLLRDIQRLGPRQANDAREPRRQGLAFEQLHHQERRTVGQQAEIEQLDQVRVQDGAHGAQLVDHGLTGRGRALALEYLQGYGPLARQLLRRVHRGMRALSEQPHDPKVVHALALHDNPAPKAYSETDRRCAIIRRQASAGSPRGLLFF